MSNPGLNITALRALRSPRHDHAMVLQRIEEHLSEQDGYVALSGGKDSVVVTHLALQVDPNVAIVYFDSGLDYPETYTYLRQLAEAWHLELEVVPARSTALEVLAATGSWDHTDPANRQIDLHKVLITEPASRAHDTHGPGELWGVRAAEARGRAAAYANALRAEIARACGNCCATAGEQRRRHGGVIRRADGTCAFGPIWDWQANDVWAYLARHDLPINPVYEKLRRLGAPESFLRVSHMLDAHRLEEGRVTWLRRGWPDLFEELATFLPRLREWV